MCICISVLDHITLINTECADENDYLLLVNFQNNCFSDSNDLALLLLKLDYVTFDLFGQMQHCKC